MFLLTGHSAIAADSAVEEGKGLRRLRVLRSRAVKAAVTIRKFVRLRDRKTGSSSGRLHSRRLGMKGICRVDRKIILRRLHGQA